MIVIHVIHGINWYQPINDEYWYSSGFIFNDYHGLERIIFTSVVYMVVNWSINIYNQWNWQSMKINDIQLSNSHWLTVKSKIIKTCAFDVHPLSISISWCQFHSLVKSWIHKNNHNESAPWFCLFPWGLLFSFSVLHCSSCSLSIR